MSAPFRFYIHNLINVYATNDYSTAYSIACQMAVNNEFILFFDSVKHLCIHHIDVLTAYNENMKV